MPHAFANARRRKDTFGLSEVREAAVRRWPWRVYDVMLSLELSHASSSQMWIE